MLNALRGFVLLSAVLVLGCAIGPSGKSFDSAIGKWNSTYQKIDSGSYSTPITIIDETKATYPNRHGQISFHAIDDQRKWEGYWLEKWGKNYVCAEARDGNAAWGRVMFQFNDQYNRFTGEWDFCGEGKKYWWNGFR